MTAPLPVAGSVQARQDLVLAWTSSSGSFPFFYLSWPLLFSCFLTSTKILQQQVQETPPPPQWVWQPSTPVEGPAEPLHRTDPKTSWPRTLSLSPGWPLPASEGIEDGVKHSCRHSCCLEGVYINLKSGTCVQRAGWPGKPIAAHPGLWSPRKRRPKRLQEQAVLWVRMGIGHSLACFLDYYLGLQVGENAEDRLLMRVNPGVREWRGGGWRQRPSAQVLWKPLEDPLEGGRIQ